MLAAFGRPCSEADTLHADSVRGSANRPQGAIDGHGHRACRIVPLDRGTAQAGFVTRAKRIQRPQSRIDLPHQPGGAGHRGLGARKQLRLLRTHNRNALVREPLENIFELLPRRAVGASQPSFGSTATGRGFRGGTMSACPTKPGKPGSPRTRDEICQAAFQVSASAPARCLYRASRPSLGRDVRPAAGDNGQP
jgi:hypothetical protein